MVQRGGYLMELMEIPPNNLHEILPGELECGNISPISFSLMSISIIMPCRTFNHYTGFVLKQCIGIIGWDWNSQHSN